MSDHAVWKFDLGPYTFPRHTQVRMLGNGSVVLFAEQGGCLRMWCEVDPTGRLNITREFVVVGTGDGISAGMKYIASCIAGDYVWHLYERPLATVRQS